MDISAHEKRRAVINDWLYIVIVGALALYLVIGVVAWAWLLLTDTSAPPAFTTVLSTIGGGLVGVLAPIGPSRRERDA